MKTSLWESRSGAVFYAIGSLFAAFVFAIVVTGGATQWLPEGAAGVDHIVLPIVGFPIVWIAMGLGLYAARRRALAWGIVGGITLVHALLIAYRFTQ
ncbi:MAG: hypothetical protein AAF211_32075 [Myxococcota bacterium]